MTNPTREELQRLMDSPYGASRQAGAALKPNGTPGRRKDPEPAGYAAPPGTGPEGETCATCAHFTRRLFAKTYLKCGLMAANWTGGRKTDVKARAPACRQWAKPEPEA